MFATRTYLQIFNQTYKHATCNIDFSLLRTPTYTNFRLCVWSKMVLPYFTSKRFGLLGVVNQSAVSPTSAQLLVCLLLKCNVSSSFIEIYVYSHLLVGQSNSVTFLLGAFTVYWSWRFFAFYLLIAVVFMYCPTLKWSLEIFTTFGKRLLTIKLWNWIAGLL